MKSLSPYETPYYFILLIILLLPLILRLLEGKRSMWYQNLLTFFFLILSFGGNNKSQGIALIFYIVWQIALVSTFFWFNQKRGQLFFYSAVLLAILPLIIVKVTPLVTGGISFIGFLGISYLTFKSVQVVMEIHDGVIKEYKISYFLQFLLFFPTISSGPIDRYRRFVGDLENVPERFEYVGLLGKGIQMIFLGFLYKFILGYLLGKQLLPFVASAALAERGFSINLLFYMYVYSMYLFFDFAGYSLFAVGTSYLMGYATPVNFNKPFLSVNIKDFWNRWHMSLSFWFRDYVYMRLVFTLIKKKIFKSRVTASYAGYLGLFLLMGAWHGLTWYYLVYGLYHAGLIILTDRWTRFKRKHQAKIPSSRWTKFLAVGLTFHAVCLSFLIFSGFLDTFFKSLH